MSLEVRINNKGTEAGEIVQRSRALAAIAEDPGSIPSSHVSSQSSVTVVLGDQQALTCAHTCMQDKHSYT